MKTILSEDKRTFHEIAIKFIFVENCKEQFQYHKHFLRSNKKKVLIWLDADSCFKKRVRTGVKINLSFKLRLELFKEASRSLILKVELVL